MKLSTIFAMRLSPRAVYFHINEVAVLKYFIGFILSVIKIQFFGIYGFVNTLSNNQMVFFDKNVSEVLLFYNYSSVL